MISAVSNFQQILLDGPLIAIFSLRYFIACPMNIIAYCGFVGFKKGTEAGDHGGSC